jgi:RNA polymerase sigma-70 factor (ECF subfamily)
VWAPGGQPRVVFVFTITRGKIVQIDMVSDREQIQQFELVVLDDTPPL